MEGICASIGADSLRFLPESELLKTVEGSGCGFCTGCFDGSYPVNPGDEDDAGLDLDL